MNDLKFEASHPYRMQLWTSRVLIIGFSVSAFLNLCLGLTIVIMMPLKKLEPFLITLKDKKDQIVKIEPLEKSMPARKLIIESMAGDFVIQKETVDLISEEARLLKVKAMSSPSLWGEFEQLLSSPQSPIKQARMRAIKSKVILNTVSWIADDRLYVDLTRIDSQNDHEVGRKSLIVTLAFEEKETALSYEDRYLNPLGLQFTQYDLSLKEN